MVMGWASSCEFRRGVAVLTWTPRSSQLSLSFILVLYAVWIVYIGGLPLLIRVALVGHNEQIELALNNVDHHEHRAATLVETSGDALCWV
jgi:hypothetical protein